MLGSFHIEPKTQEFDIAEIPKHMINTDNEYTAASLLS